MTVYKHLTGKDRAEQKFAGVNVDANEHPVRSDFVDASVLVDVTANENSGLPVTENATAAEKTAQEAL